MSPEQATGLVEEIDHRADQWALGCIVWEMLSGRAPFVADDMSALFYQLINLDPHPLARRVQGLPPEVEPVLRRALAKQAGNRYPSIKDFSRAFEAAATGREREVTPPPVLVSVPVPKGTVAYGGRVAPGKPVDAVVQAVAPTQLAASSDRGGDTYRDGLDLPEDDVTARRFKPIYLIPVAVVLLVAGLLLLWPRKSPPSTVTPQAPTLRAPEVVTLPAPPSAPSVTVPPPETVPSHSTKAKLAKGASSADVNEVTSTPRTSEVGRKPSPYSDPFEQETPKTKAAQSPAGPKAPKVRSQRKIVEEL
jgi:serine/threonine-protein kinase